MVAIKELSDESTEILIGQTLSDIEAETFQTLKAASLQRGIEWFGGRLALKKSVSELFRYSFGSSIPMKEVTVDSLIHGNYKGKPEVRLPFHVSISHSGGIAMASASCHRIGIDIQRIQPVSDYVMRGGFTHSELNIVAKAPESAKNSVKTLIWSCKESVVKSLGMGLRIKPGSVEIDLRHQDQFYWELSERDYPFSFRPKYKACYFIRKDFVFTFNIMY